MAEFCFVLPDYTRRPGGQIYSYQRHSIGVISPTEKRDRITLSSCPCLSSCVFESKRVADMVDTLPAIVAQSRSGIKKGQADFSSQSC